MMLFEIILLGYEKKQTPLLMAFTEISNARFQFLQGWSDLLDPIATMMGCGHILSFLEARVGAWVSKKKLKVKVPGWMKVRDKIQ